MSEPTPSEPQPATLSSIGERLRQARKRQQMELSEVARTLRLSPEAVEALEQDNYQPFAAPAYVRGYLRNYARLVGVSEQAVRPEFASAGHSAANAPKVKSFDKLTKPQNNHLGSWIALGGFLILLGAGWFALQQGWFSSAESSSGPTESTRQILDLDDL